MARKINKPLEIKDLTKFFTVYIPIYETYIEVYVSDDIANTSKAAEDKYPEYLKPYKGADKCMGLFRCSDETASMYWMFLKKKTSINTLVHECVHATSRILYDRGIPINYDNDETFAYLHGYIVEQIHKQI